MSDDFAGPVGPVSYPVLVQIRDLLLSEEPLVSTTAFDNPVNPTELVVELSAGLDSPGRFEITWWEQEAYRFHYTEPEGLNFRFDSHPKDGAPAAHFHPPPAAGRAEPSFLDGISQSQVVTRAVMTRWRTALIDERDVTTLNQEKL